MRAANDALPAFTQLQYVPINHLSDKKSSSNKTQKPPTCRHSEISPI